MPRSRYCPHTYSSPHLLHRSLRLDKLAQCSAILKTMNWRLHTKNRSWLTAVTMCFLIFTSQFALASYICPQESAAQQACPMGKSDQSSNPSPSALCTKHCYPEAQTSDAHFPVFIALLPPALTWRLPEHAPIPLIVADIASCPATGPPIAIQFCRFRE